MNGNGALLSNGSLKQSRQASSSRGIARVSLPGTKLYGGESYIDREEFVRLVIQSLRDVGYVESAATLEAESGYTMEAPDVSNLRQCILDGQWDIVEDILTRLAVLDEDHLRAARYLISQQKYLELLERQRVNAALRVLRQELAPLNIDVDELHTLSSYIMCSSAEDLQLRAQWDGAAGESRRHLLEKLQTLIPASVMIPQRRFVGLLEQAYKYQRSQCLYHNAPYDSSAFSLYSDHHCSRDAFPSTTTNILGMHKDEVWNLAWSHDGQHLASASRDKTAIIWHIGAANGEWEMMHVLNGHEYPVGALAWSPDDSILLTSSESVIKVWDVQSGENTMNLDAKDHHNDAVTALIWLPDGSGFLSAGMDKVIILWGPDGKKKEVWATSIIRIVDLALAPDLTRLVAIGIEVRPAGNNNGSGSQESNTPPASSPANSTPLLISENKMVIYNFATRTQEASLLLDGELTSVKVSDDSRYALLNHAPDEVQLWDLEHRRMARKFTGQRQGCHIIRSCFGGVDSNFILSGSEDKNVYVWHRETGSLLEVLAGHGDGSVNAIAWNPKNERMFASCSDDGHVRIWEPMPSEASGIAGTALPSAIEHNGKGKGRS